MRDKGEEWEEEEGRLRTKVRRLQKGWGGREIEMGRIRDRWVGKKGGRRSLTREGEADRPDASTCMH